MIRHVAVIASLLLAPALVSAAPATIDQQLATYIDLNRKLTVTLAGTGSLESGQRTRRTAVGWLIYADERRTFADLIRALVDDRAAHGLPRINAFLDRVASTTDLAPADRLALLDVADELAGQLGDVSALDADRIATKKRLDALVADLERVRDEYGAEVDASVPRTLAHGAEPSRAKWNGYVEGLRRTIDVDAVLSHYAKDAGLPAIEHGFAVRERRDAVVFGGDLPAKHIVLTFDDGPHPRHTMRVLEILRAHNTPACFFELGGQLGKMDDHESPRLMSSAAAISAQVRDAGYQLANHSYSHFLMTKLGTEARRREIASTNALVGKVRGTPPLLFRPPYGGMDDRLTDQVRKMGMKIIMWNIDSRDWADRVPQSIAARVVAAAHGQGRGIVLLHDIHGQTVQALPSIIDQLTKDGFVFDSLASLD